jgi:hypothetical protein
MRRLAIIVGVVLIVLGVIRIVLNPYNLESTALIPIGCVITYWGRSMDHIVSEQRLRQAGRLDRKAIFYLVVFAVCELVVAILLKFRTEVVLFEVATWFPIAIGIIRLRKSR